MKTRMISLAIVVLIFPLVAATKCQTAPVAAPAGGGSVYVGVHPPLRAGSWAKVKANTWHFVAYAALAAALAQAGHRIVLAEQADAQTPARKVVLTVYVENAQGYGSVCYGKPENFLLATWKLPDGSKLNLDCIGWKRSATDKLKIIVDCLTRIMGFVSPPVTRWDGMFGGKMKFWDFGTDGEIITHLDDTIYSVRLPNFKSWAVCAEGESWTP